MSKRFNIVMIGTGNLAFHLASKINTINNFTLVQAYNHRRSKSAKQFEVINQCKVVTQFSELNCNADLYIIAVKDDAIAEVANQLSKLKLKGIVVHTSGSVDMLVLKNTSKQIGVLYPLQTFYPKANINWEQTPFLIEGNVQVVQNKLKKMAQLISENVQVVNSQQRLIIHLAAVFACNFTNALYASSFELVKLISGKKSNALLFPIMQQSFDKLKTIHPIEAQTGPAKRHDALVVKKHQQLLKNNKQLLSVYNTLTQLIISQQAK